MASWQSGSCAGLQIPLPRFDSGRGLQISIASFAFPSDQHGVTQMSLERSQAYVAFAEDYLSAAEKVGITTFNVSSWTTDSGSSTLSASFIDGENASHPSSGFLGVYFFCIGHAVELLLKAFLLRKGLETTDLRRLGHNINNLVGECKDRGIVVDGIDNLRILGDYHRQHVFRYPDDPRPDAPNAAIVNPAVQNLLSALR